MYMRRLLLQLVLLGILLGACTSEGTKEYPFQDTSLSFEKHKHLPTIGEYDIMVGSSSSNDDLKTLSLKVNK